MKLIDTLDLCCAMREGPGGVFERRLKRSRAVHACMHCGRTHARQGWGSPLLMGPD